MVDFLPTVLEGHVGFWTSWRGSWRNPVDGKIRKSKKNMTKPLTSKSSGMTDPEKLPSSFVEVKLVQLGGGKTLVKTMKKKINPSHKTLPRVCVVLLK